MAVSYQHHLHAPAIRSKASRRPAVLTRAIFKPASAGLAAAGAAIILAGSSPVFAVPDQPVDPANNITTIASSGSEAGRADKGLFTKLLDSIPSPFPKVNEDPFGADRAQERTVGDTKKPIPIITEQEAVAPEAFPNPSEAYSPRPPVLAAAEGDEHQGENAGQFQGLDASGRQELIDKKSPAQSSSN